MSNIFDFHEAMTKALGLPENTVSFKLHCGVDTVPTVECIYHVMDFEKGVMELVDKKFVFAELNESSDSVDGEEEAHA